MSPILAYLAGASVPTIVAVWGWSWCQHERLQRCRADIEAARLLRLHRLACHEWMHTEALLEDEIAGRKREVEAYERLQGELREVEAETVRQRAALVEQLDEIASLESDVAAAFAQAADWQATAHRSANYGETMHRRALKAEREVERLKARIAHKPQPLVAVVDRLAQLQREIAA